MMDEQIIVVDADDNPIGYKNRDKLNYSKDIYRVSSLWLANSKSEVLIAQRSAAKERGANLWGPAAEGTVGIGENYKDCMIREADEELGLINLDFKVGPKIFRNGTRKYYRQLFLATIDKEVIEFQLQKEEVEQVRWISPEDLVRDVGVNPDKYVSSMPKVLEALGLN